MDTVMIAGKEVPISDLIAAHTELPNLRQEVQSLREAQEAATGQIQAAAKAQEAISRAENDPAFARQFADRIAELHADSAYFREEPTPTPAADPDKSVDTNGDPLPIQPTPTVSPDITTARELEEIRARLDRREQEDGLNAMKQRIVEQYPGIDIDAVLEKAVQDGVAIQHLPLVAGAIEAERLSGELTKTKQNNTMLDGLLTGSGAVDADDGLARLGLSVSQNDLGPDADVDYGELSVEDSVALAMSQRQRSEVS